MSVKHWHTWCQNYFFGTWNAFGKPDNSGLLSNSYDTNIRYALRMAMLTNEDFLLKDSGKVVVVFEWKLTLHFKNRIPRSIIAVVMIRAILCQFCVRDFMDLPAINKRKNEREKRLFYYLPKWFRWIERWTTVYGGLIPCVRHTSKHRCRFIGVTNRKR